MTVEFTLIAPLLLAALFGAVQIFIIDIAKAELASLGRSGSRIVLTGQATSTAATAATFSKALCAQNTLILDCSKVLVNLTPQASCANVSTALPTLTYDGSGKITTNFNFNAGAAGGIMVLQLFYAFPVAGGQLFSFSGMNNGQLMLTTTFVFANEPGL